MTTTFLVTADNKALIGAVVYDGTDWEKALAAYQRIKNKDEHDAVYLHTITSTETMSWKKHNTKEDK